MAATGTPDWRVGPCGGCHSRASEPARVEPGPSIDQVTHLLRTPPSIRNSGSVTLTGSQLLCLAPRQRMDPESEAAPSEVNRHLQVADQRCEQIRQFIGSVFRVSLVRGTVLSVHHVVWTRIMRLGRPPGAAPTRTGPRQRGGWSHSISDWSPPAWPPECRRRVSEGTFWPRTRTCREVERHRTQRTRLGSRRH